jgi:RNA polymerase sigma-70 factor (ECF subfamily)
MGDRLDQAGGFTGLVETHRGELHAHCYRMLGSVHDADDALQETLIRAWRGWAGLREGSSARGWLYAIATNVCLTEIDRRTRRALPRDFGPSVDGRTPPGVPAVETAWIEPYPDMHLASAAPAPEARYEQREAVELAFVAALQHLAANQRAVLILRDVLGFSAQETAQMLSTSVASVNSAMQRARSSVADRVPERSQQATLRALDDSVLHDLLGRWVRAWEDNDVDALAALLVEDSAFAMPPLTTWYAPRAEILAWARAYSLNGLWQWRALLTSASGQPALGFYSWDESSRAYLPFALNVLTLRGGLVSEVTAFIVRTTEAEDADYRRFPDQPVDRGALEFAQFGLPATLAG